MFAASKTASVSGGYQIQRSLRFNSADSAYLNRTPASAGSRNIWTCSFWIKPSLQNIANIPTIIGVDTSGTDGIQFDTSYRLAVVAGGSDKLITSQVFRDPSAWYHVVVAADVTQGTATNRLKIYVNGSEVTAFASDNRSTLASNSFKINTAIVHHVGNNPAVNRYYDGYLAELYMIDGQQLAPTAFGETNAQTGVWQPKAYSGSYGTNGFYLNFSDNSNTTAATLGKDYSGNGNNWTPNNFSVTAGAGNDSLVDSPTSYGTDTGAGGTVRGNYATLNPLKKKSAATISNGNLALVATSAVYVTGLSTISPSSGTYYMEMLCSGSNSNRPWAIGVVNANASADASMSDTGTYFVTNNSGSTVNYYLGGSPTALSTSSTWVAGDIISLAWNVDSGKFWVGRNGVWYPSSTGGTVASNADVSAGNYPTFTISYSGNTNPQVIPAFVTYDTTASIDANFGQRPFAYTAPSGYKALCTQNLPTPTIGATTATQAGKYFNPVLYTGNGGTQSVTGVGFQPDWVWLKTRSASTNHFLTDAVRGAGFGLYSDLTSAEANNSSVFTGFASDGFNLAGGNLALNANGSTYVAWNWKANGSGSTNTAGSITSTVSANTTSGFSIVTYTGNGSLNATFGHGLGVVPSMIIVKSRSNANAWPIYHSALGANKYIYLNLTQAPDTVGGLWGASGPSSSLVYLPTSTSQGEVNGSGTTYVAYCFAEVAGYSKFGSYTGNGSSDGPFVYTGFRPAFVMTKRTDLTSDWTITDLRRPGYNLVNKSLYANQSSAELTYNVLDQVSNGFKLRDADGIWNGSGGTYIFMAFAESPFKYSLAR